MSATEKATLAGGCFWCLEAVFERLQGVESVVSGYAGGSPSHANYESVCTGATGHAEVVQITFDPTVIAYADLLDVFFTTHDPTTLNRQGADAGTQYRSAIFYGSEAQKVAAAEKIAELDAAGVFPAKIVTKLEPLDTFFPAEKYHQGYYRGNSDQPYCRAVVAPKVAKLRQKFAHRLKEGAA